MASYNKVILMGNLTRDPEVRTLPSGSSVAKFSIAVSRSFTGSDGSAKEETSFVDIEAFARSAENIGKFFGKGKAILVEGHLRQDRWESPAGEKRNKLVVVLDRWEFVGSKGQQGESNFQDGSSLPSYEDTSPPARSSGKSQGQTYMAAKEQQAGFDDDIPF